MLLSFAGLGATDARDVATHLMQASICGRLHPLTGALASKCILRNMLPGPKGDYSTATQLQDLALSSNNDFFDIKTLLWCPDLTARKSPYAGRMRAHAGDVWLVWPPPDWLNPFLSH